MTFNDIMAGGVLVQGKVTVVLQELSEGKYTTLYEGDDSHFEIDDVEQPWGEYDIAEIDGFADEPGIVVYVER